MCMECKKCGHNWMVSETAIERSRAPFICAKCGAEADLSLASNAPSFTTLMKNSYPESFSPSPARSG